MKKLLTLLLLLISSMVAAQVAPSLYYQFTNPTPLASTVGGSLTGGGTYSITASDVGTALTWANNNGSYLQAPALSGSAVSIQFLWKSNYETARGTSVKTLTWGDIGITFEYPFLYFNTPGNHSAKIEFYGINNKSWETVMGGSWNHFAFVYAGTSKQVWINGQKVYEGACPAGSISGQPAISSTVNYVKVRGSIDEFAFYNQAIPERQIYQNYLDWQAGNHYQTVLAPAVIPGPPVDGSLDTNEFTLDIPRNLQLSKYPGPRYKPGNTLLKNANWFDPLYLGGAQQAGIGTNQTIIAANANQIQAEMATNWNYYYHIAFNNTQFFNMQAISQANANPQWKFQTILFRGQYGSKILSKTLPNANYLQNSFGQYLDINGNVLSDTTKKIWRPTAPISSYTSDGQFVYNEFTSLFNSFNHTFDLINENGEIFPLITDNALSKDPQVVSAKNASGLSYQAFLARKFAENESQAYRDIIMAHPKLVGKKFTEYAVDGFPQYRFLYSEARKANTMINGQYYSTPDFYVRYPYNWRYWISAWHGWQWIVESRVNELAVGDKLYSPFVSAGWDATESNNVRPAQFLGLLKCLVATGAEFFYGAFFSLQAPWPDSKNWIWQVSTSSYAQAIGSRVEPFLRNGSLLSGDVPASYSSGTNPGYNFYSGRNNTIVSVRKMNDQEKYFIAATLQNISNTGDTPLQDTVTVRLAGADLKMNVRRQGSTYIWDRTVTPNTFVQLDSWHEYKHPSRWSADFRFEAEVTDGGTGTIATTASGTDYTSFTSSYKGTGQYTFLPRDTANYFLYIRAKSDSAMEITATIGATTQTVCIDSTDWKWVRYEADTSKAVFALGSPSPYTLNLSTGNAIVDQFVLSKDSALYTTTYSSCGGTPPPPVCTWVTGAWSAWSACNGTFQTRTRTVTSSLQGCTPAGAAPAAIDTQACSLPPVTCVWSAGAWSNWTVCAADTQYRTRTVVSTVVGCTPTEQKPDTIEVRSCTTAVAEPSGLRVLSNRWYNTIIEWSYSGTPDLFQVELTRAGDSPRLYNYSATTRRVTYILRWSSDYTFRIRAVKGAMVSQWTTINFRTR